MTDGLRQPFDRPDDAPAVPREDLAIFAHELRGALTVIGGYSDMLRRPLREDERLAALDGIRRAVRRADTLCSEVLSGRHPSSPTAAPPQRVELWALAEQVAAEQRAATKRSVIVEAPGGIAVAGDESALARVLTNLVTNALKYSPDAEPVLVSVDRAVTSDLGDAAVIEISDRGPGIPADKRERIFEPFERLERDAGVPGTGLGLAIVRDVVRSHGGTIAIGDHAGGGTTVRVELPLLPAAD